MDPGTSGGRYRFGIFEFDAETLELRREGRPVKVRPQALKLLALVLARPGELVSRDAIRMVLWSDDTFVDFDQAVNHLVKQLRDVLGDAAESPRYIQTLPRRGYRFIAPVEVDKPRAPGAPDVGTTPPRRTISQTRALLTGAAVLVVVVVGTARFAWQPAGGDPGELPRTLAVLPYASNTDPALGLGLADEISRRLGTQRLVAVRPPRVGRDRTTVRGSAADAGRAVGADLVLDGEVERQGGEITVLAQLTDVNRTIVTWSQRFQVRADELFNVQDVIAERVAGALNLRLAADEQGRLLRRYTSNAPAYEDYLRGRAAMVEYTPEGTRRAVEAFERALERDAGYALARAGLAAACADMYLRFAPPSQLERWGERAESEARAALALDPDLAEAHLARAAVARKREFDWSTALVAARQALVLNPNLEQAHFFMAAAYYHLGYMEEALIELERGRRLQGLDIVEPVRIEALVALFSGRFAPARVHLEEVSRRSSQPIGDTYLALAYYYSGNVERGRQMLESLTSHQSASTASRAAAALAGVLAAIGRPAEARTLVQQVLARDYRDHHVAYNVGAAYAQLGNDDEALKWLRTAADTGFPCLIWFERDPLLDPIRKSPPFADLLAHARAVRDRVSAPRITGS